MKHVSLFLLLYVVALVAFLAHFVPPMLAGLRAA